MRSVKLMKRCGRVLIVSLIVLAVQACDSADAKPHGEEDLRIFVAASVAHVVEPLVDAFAETHGITVHCSTAASSTLARQIEHGADADVFLSANGLWMDRLEGAGLIRADSRHDLLGNRLVLVTHADRDTQTFAHETVTEVLAHSSGRIAVGDPDHVPAGMYARAALESLGVWEDVASRIVPMKDTRAALLLVARNETELGIVYATDAASVGAARVVARFEESNHPPIRYPVALTRDASPRAEALLSLLRSPRACEAFAGAGFVVLVPWEEAGDGW